MTAYDLTNELKKIILDKYGSIYNAAEAVEMSKPTLYQMVGRPSYSTAFKLADIFNINVEITVQENK